MKNVIFDMETSDPDDFLTLCWLAANPNVRLIGVTVTPGTKEQIGLVAETLFQCNIPMPPIGSFDPSKENGCVSEFHYKVMRGPSLVEADGTGADIIKQCLTEHPDATLITGGPLKNLYKFLETYPEMELQHWVAQGGFAGDSLVTPENRLAKFAGRETCPTFNFNGDVQGALLALSSNKIVKRTLVSKNVCHGISYDSSFHEEFKKALQGKLRYENGACFLVSLMEEDYRDYDAIKEDIIAELVEALGPEVHVLYGMNKNCIDNGYVLNINRKTGGVCLEIELYRVENGKTISRID